MGEVLGEAARAKSLSDRVVQLFIRYLELLQVDGVSKRTEAGRVAPEGRVVLPPEAPGEPWAIDPDDLADAYADALGGQIDNALPPDEWIARLATLPLIDQPGRGFHYGLSTDLLGFLIARLDGAR